MNNNNGFERTVNIDPSSVPGASDGPISSPQNNQTNANSYSSQNKPTTNTSGGGQSNPQTLSVGASTEVVLTNGRKTAIRN